MDIAVKAAEKKAFTSMKKVKGTEAVRKIRKRMWFEKFLWFISSDGLVVVGGRDAQQNEVWEVVQQQPTRESTTSINILTITPFFYSL